jgi:hypothetical protein
MYKFKFAHVGFLMLLASCVPTAFEPKDENGNSIDITGQWSGESAITGIRTYSESLGSNEAAITNVQKSAYDMRVVVTLMRGEGAEIVGKVNHINKNSNSLQSYNNLRVVGSIKNAVFFYSNIDNSLQWKINGIFNNENFKGTMSAELSYDSIVISPNGSRTVSKNKNYLTYSIELTRIK